MVKIITMYFTFIFKYLIFFGIGFYFIIIITKCFLVDVKIKVFTLLLDTQIRSNMFVRLATRNGFKVPNII